MFVVGVFVYGAAHGMLPWQARRALKRRAEAAESALADMRTDLDSVRADLAKALRELDNAPRVSIAAAPAPPPFET